MPLPTDFANSPDSFITSPARARPAACATAAAAVTGAEAAEPGAATGGGIARAATSAANAAP